MDCLNTTIEALNTKYEEKTRRLALAQVGSFIDYYHQLCQSVEALMRKNEASEEEIRKRGEESDLIDFCQRNLSFYIPFEHSTKAWLDKGPDFSAGDVTTALRAFERINPKVEAAKLAHYAYETSVKLISNDRAEIDRIVLLATSTAVDAFPTK